MSKPATDELEVTVFGPGFGESIVVHIGLGRWVIVDSCLDQLSSEPAALKYLRQLGEDPAACVDLIIISHWHDDHIAGISEVVKQCPEARVVLSAALRRNEFLQVAATFEIGRLTQSSGVTEMMTVYDILRSRGEHPHYAICDGLVGPNSFEIKNCEVFALSPSSHDFARFLHSMTKLTPVVGQTKFRIPDPRENELAVVISIRVDDVQILLGSDLEENADLTRGWSAVLQTHSWRKGRAEVFKVPHHGSQNGHHPRVWTDMLTTDPLAIATPWNRGSKLPTDNDVGRIASLSHKAFLTSEPKKRPSNRRAPAVEKTLRESGITIHRAEPATGSVRLRKRDTWSVELSPEALQM